MRGEEVALGGFIEGIGDMKRAAMGGRSSVDSKGDSAR